MIVYACAVSDGDVFARCAEPGIRRVMEVDPGAEMLAQPSAGTIFRNYNLLCEQVAGREDLEALVLLHQDVEIADSGLSGKLREVLADPDVAIAGCAGAIGVRSLAWWEGSITWASVTQRYDELGGGEVEGVSWRADSAPPYTRVGEVDAVDGCLLALSPWAARNLRFDESIGASHGYDVDICLQARAAGKKVLAADLRVVHHHSLELLSAPEEWIRAHIALAEKWEGELDRERLEDWRGRARRAEAEASAYRLRMGAAQLQRDAALGMVDDVQRSTSWRLTRPLRAIGRSFRRGR
jgi:Glycosyltransferase like family